MGFVTLVACLAADVAWQNHLKTQLLRQLNGRSALMQMSGTISQVPGIARFLGGGGVPAGNDSNVAYEYGSWVVDRGSKAPDSLLLDISVSRLSNRLRRLGAVPGEASRTGMDDRSGCSGLFWSGAVVEYSYANMKGRILLRFVPSGSKDYGGILFMDHALVRY